jgi:hypothetical protein
MIATLAISSFEGSISCSQVKTYPEKEYHANCDDEYDIYSIWSLKKWIR